MTRVYLTLLFTVATVGAKAGQMNDRFAQDFQSQLSPQAIELIGGEAPSRFCRLDSGGLRCTIPTGSTDVTFCGASVKFVVKGDFEITGAYKILRLPQPNKGHGAGAKISIMDYREEKASLQRLCLGDGRQVYSAHRAEMKDGSYEHDSEIVPTDATSGRLRLKRSGTTIQYLVAEGDGGEFRELRKAEFTDGDLVRVYFAAQTGEAATGVDIVWTNIVLQAEELVRTYEEANKWSLWPVALLVVIVLLMIVAVVVHRTRTSAGG